MILYIKENVVTLLLIKRKVISVIYIISMFSLYYLDVKEIYMYIRINDLQITAVKMSKI